jgi:hypothetical protein
MRPAYLARLAAAVVLRERFAKAARASSNRGALGDHPDETERVIAEFGGNATDPVIATVLRVDRHP